MVMTKLTTERVVERFREAHGDRYDYSQVEWTGDWSAKLTIVCREHGPFYQQYATHTNGRGCRSCGVITNRRNRRAPKQLDQEECLRRFREKHGDKYDYSKVEFESATKPVTIICPAHGEFTGIPQNHWKQSADSCRQCSLENQRRRTASQIVARFQAVWGDEYDYSKFEYQHMHALGTVICRKHGQFSISAANLLQAHGCGSCWQNTASKMETAWGDALEGALGLKLQREQHVLGGRWGRIDMLLEVGDRKLVIEYDGSYWHSRPDSMDKDIRKTAALAALGYRVIRLRAIEKGRHPLVDVPGAICVTVQGMPVPEQVQQVTEIIRGVLRRA